MLLYGEHGKYLIHRQINKGGFAKIYEAEI